MVNIQIVSMKCIQRLRTIGNYSILNEIIMLDALKPKLILWLG